MLRWKRREKQLAKIAGCLFVAYLCLVYPACKHGRLPIGDDRMEIVTTVKTRRIVANRGISSDGRMESDVTRINDEQKINNAHFLSNDTDFRIVIIVQVHKRLQYLRKLLASLSRSRHIDETLVILSHDFYSAEINEFVRKQSAFPLLQIFYPTSIQQFPDVFPGTDPDDCARDIGQQKALEKNCNNAKYPDMYGHYREAKITQTKHHWIWKLRRVFDELRATRRYDGPVLLLEEDHYVVDDFVHVIGKLTESWGRWCSDCHVGALGNYRKLNAIGDLTRTVEITQWISSSHNMGIVMNRTFWNRFSTCLSEFCHYDDYNWDWTLQHVGNVCFKPPKFNCLALSSPRVFHIGECEGLHHKGTNCNPDQRVIEIERVIARSKKSLYPSELIFTKGRASFRKAAKPNGGWGDIRDHDLCMKNGQKSNKTT